jgi:hypothetical protein
MACHNSATALKAVMVSGGWPPALPCCVCGTGLAIQSLTVAIVRAGRRAQSEWHTLAAAHGKVQMHDIGCR